MKIFEQTSFSLGYPTLLVKPLIVERKILLKRKILLENLYLCSIEKTADTQVHPADIQRKMISCLLMDVRIDGCASQVFVSVVCWLNPLSWTEQRKLKKSPCHDSDLLIYNAAALQPSIFAGKYLDRFGKNRILYFMLGLSSSLLQGSLCNVQCVMELI